MQSMIQNESQNLDSQREDQSAELPEPDEIDTMTYSSIFQILTTNNNSRFFQKTRKDILSTMGIDNAVQYLKMLALKRKQKNSMVN